MTSNWYIRQFPWKTGDLILRVDDWHIVGGYGGRREYKQYAYGLEYGPDPRPEPDHLDTTYDHHDGTVDVWSSRKVNIR